MKLYFSRRRMLNRLSFAPQPVEDLIDPATGQTHGAAYDVLCHLEELGLAVSHQCNWTITDAGVAAAVENGCIYSEGVGR